KEMELFKDMAELTHPFKPGRHLMERTVREKLKERFDARSRQKKGDDRLGREVRAAVAAVRQIKGPATGEEGQQMARDLAALPGREATEELARLAVFSIDDPVRQEAIKGLSGRREGDSPKVLTEALRYPWPQVARNAAEAIVKLKRKDLLPQLV